MPSQADLVEAYRGATSAVQVRVSAQAGAAWLQMTSWSDAAAEQLLDRVVPLVLAGQRQTATMTAAYVAQMTGSPIGRLDIDQFIGAAVRNGADPLDVYARAVREARIVYSRSDLVDLAVNRGMQQLLGTVQTDLQLSSTHAARSTMASAGVDVYRRATRAGACPLCVAASDRVYYVEQLLPVHRGCHCKAVPGAKLPRGLRRANNQTDPTDGRGLVIYDNDEIGPVLDYADRVKDAKGFTPKKVGPTLGTLTDADRIAMKRAQLAGYDTVIAGGGGNQWLASKAAEIRAELSALESAQQTTR